MSADRVLRKSERCKLRAAETSKVSEPEAKNARVTIDGTKFMADGKDGSKMDFKCLLRGQKTLFQQALTPVRFVPEFFRQ